MNDFFVNLLYAAIAAGLAVWLWLLRQPLLEKQRHKLYWWATSVSVGSGFAAVGYSFDALAGKESTSLGLFFLSIFIAGLIVTAVRNIWYRTIGKLFNRGSSDDHIRGAAIADERAVSKMLRGEPSRFSVGAVPVPVELETRGFLLAGAPGTGKSQTLTHALDALRADDARAVIADASGIYTSRYYQDGKDVIINPFDKRCVAWSPLAEVESVADIPALAKSLVPDAEGSAAEWNGYAQTFIEAVLEYCFSGGLSNSEFFRLVCVAPLDELREICAGTPAAALVAEGNERMFGSVRAIASSACKFVQYLDPAADAKSGFSIRKHIIEEKPGFIFLSYQQQHRDAQKSQIACCVDVAARAVLSLPPSRDRRVIFALDELPLLGKVQSIIDLATNGRKHGAMIFAGLQTISQLRDSYGRETAQTLLACLGSWLVLRVSDAETAEYMSRYLGEEEKTRIVQSGGESQQDKLFGEKSTSENWQQQIVKDRVVLPSELQSLPDLRGIFNLAGPVPSAIVTLQIAPDRKIADAFIAAPPRVREKPQQHANDKSDGGGDSRGNDNDAPPLDLL